MDKCKKNNPSRHDRYILRFFDFVFCRKKVYHSKSGTAKHSESCCTLLLPHEYSNGKILQLIYYYVGALLALSNDLLLRFLRDCRVSNSASFFLLVALLFVEWSVSKTVIRALLLARNTWILKENIPYTDEVKVYYAEHLERPRRCVEVVLVLSGFVYASYCFVNGHLVIPVFFILAIFSIAYSFLKKFTKGFAICVLIFVAMALSIFLLEGQGFNYKIIVNCCCVVSFAFFLVVLCNSDVENTSR